MTITITQVGVIKRAAFFVLAGSQAAVFYEQNRKILAGHPHFLHNIIQKNKGRNNPPNFYDCFNQFTSVCVKLNDAQFSNLETKSLSLLSTFVLR